MPEERSTVSEERWEEYSRQMLDGRPVPDDLRILASAQWEGRRHPFANCGIRILEPGDQNPLTDISCLSEQALADPDLASNIAATEQMAAYLKVVAESEDSECFGYWLHPEQQADSPAPIIKQDSEGQYSTLGGRTLAEALLDELAFEDDETFAWLVEGLARLGISIAGSSTEDLAELTARPSPGRVHRSIYDAERARRGLPD